MEKSRRSLEIKCLMWFTGPTRIEKPTMTSKLPTLNASANFAGRTGSHGSPMNAKKKHTTAPTKHAPKPSNLSHRDRANQASSSFDRSPERSGI